MFINNYLSNLVQVFKYTNLCYCITHILGVLINYNYFDD